MKQGEGANALILIILKCAPTAHTILYKALLHFEFYNCTSEILVETMANIILIESEKHDTRFNVT